MFLLGGGFAISKGSVASCLAKRIGEALVPLRHLPPVLILFIVSIFVGSITEFTSNVGIANITLPVIAQMVKINTRQLILRSSIDLLLMVTVFITVCSDGDTPNVFNDTGCHNVFLLVSITGWYATECNCIGCRSNSDKVAHDRGLRPLHIRSRGTNDFLHHLGYLCLRYQWISRMGQRCSGRQCEFALRLNRNAAVSLCIVIFLQCVRASWSVSSFVK